MLFMKFYKKIIQTTLRHLNAHVSSKTTIQLVNYCNHSRTKLLRTSHSPNLLQNRNCSDDSQTRVRFPALRDDPKIIWTGFFSTMKNIILSSFIIPQFDNEFSLGEFLEGSKQALSIVSSALAREDYDSIKDLVTPEVIESVRYKINNLSSEQKELIAVDKEDINMIFPYQVGIIFDKNNAQKIFVEITVVYHSMRDFNRLKTQTDDPIMFCSFIPKYQKDIFVSNYRFIREFTKGIETSWTVNLINHFMMQSNE